MEIARTITVLDAADPDAVAAFWAGVYGGKVRRDSPGWRSVLVGGESRLEVQHVPSHRPPEWPDGTPQQVHFDLYIDDLDAAHDEVTALGARLLQKATDPSADHGFQVYADPAGHPFCLCWGS
jgi:predicted enzyme related to lactoylglutathione lyase